jgi:hypothetical protein
MDTRRIPSNSTTRWRRRLRLLVWLYPCLLCGALALSIFAVPTGGNTFSKVSCDCNSLISLSDEISGAQSIFVGKVISAHPAAGSDEGTIRFQVISAWKGVTQSDYLMYWPGLWVACDPKPKVDEQWLVYAEPRQDGHPVMSPCGRTVLLSTEAAREDIVALGKAKWDNPTTTSP